MRPERVVPWTVAATVAVVLAMPVAPGAVGPPYQELGPGHAAVASYQEPDGPGHAAGGVGPLPGSDPVSDRPGRQRGRAPDAAPDLPAGAFGFAVGEERRYILAPAEALRPGVRLEWWIRLAEVVDGDGPGPVAVFELEHSDETPGVGPGEVHTDWVRTSGELRVTLDGFPVSLSFTEQDGVSGGIPFQGEPRRTRLDLVDGRFRKESVVEGRTWESDIPIASHGELDVDVPRGLFVFEPSESGFLANPGLLDVVLPRPLERHPERREVLFFTPEGTSRFYNGFADRDSRRVISEYYRHGHVERQGRGPVQVGSRTLEAWRIEVGGSGRDAWVDSTGRVVRYDLSDNPLTGQKHWIRILHPDEY